MKIAFYKGMSHGNLIDKIICVATLSRYSHCEIVFDDGVCASSSMRDGGVRFKSIELDSEKWTVLKLKRSCIEEMAIRSFFNLHEGTDYDLVGAVRSWLGLKTRNDQGFFCSEIVSLVLGMAPNQTPGSIYRELTNAGLIEL